MRASIASRLGLPVATGIPSWFFLPKFSLPARTERLRRQRHRGTLSGPGAGWIENSSGESHAIKQAQAAPHHPTAQREDPGMQHGRPPQLELPALSSRLRSTGFGEITPVVQKMMMQVDID